MKKIVSAVCAVAALAASFALFSCQGATSYSGAIDTVYNLDGPGNLTAKAYPGTNIITWSTVKDANGYEIYRDNAYLGFVDESETCVYSDSDILEDGKTYKYKVVSTSKSNVSRTPYANNGESTVDCRAIVPAVGTAALDLAAKEDGYDKNAAVLSADTITATVVDGSVYVTFPAKPYLSYTVYTSADNEIAAKGGLGYVSSGTNVGQTTTAYAKVAITDSGKKTITVAASSANQIYAKSTVTATATVTVPALSGITASSNVKAVWASATKAHITFTGVKLTDGKYAPASYYKVYRYADLAYTEVTGVTESTTNTSSTAVAYYVDDASAPAAGCTYYVAITNGTAYGTSANGTLAAYSAVADAITLAPPSAVMLDADGISNDIKLTVTVPNDETAAVSYADAGITANDNLVAADYTNAVTLPASYEPTTDGKVYTIFIKDLTVDHYYYFRAVASKTGYTDKVTCSSETKISNGTLSGAAHVSASTYALPTSTTTNNISVLVTDSASNTTETFANYSYELFRSEQKKVTNGYEWTEWTSLGAITLTATVTQPFTTSTSYEYVYTATGVADGTYAYMVVKTDSASKTFTVSKVSNTSTVAITTTADAKAAKSTLSDIYTAGTSRSAETSGTVMFYVNTTNAAGYTFTLYRAPVAANGSSQMDEYSVCSLTAATTAGQPGSAYTLYTYTDNSVVKNTAYSYYLKATKTDATDVYSDTQTLGI